MSIQFGSISVIADAGGEWADEQRYKACGEVRYAAGVMPTRYTYTGQYSYTEGFGLMFYNARWYDPAVGRFAQGDTIVPEGVQGWDRYAYVNNNPLRYMDASGHDVGCAGYDALLCGGGNTTIAGDTRLIEGIVRERMRFGYDPDPQSTRAIVYQRLKVHHPQLSETAISLYYAAIPTPEPIIKSSPSTPVGPYFIIKITYNLNYDKTDAIIDILGLVGNAVEIGGGFLGQPEIVLTANVAGDVIEGGGLIKSLVDLLSGDPQSMIVQQLQTTIEQWSVIFFRAERMVPYVGFFGNLGSLAINLKPKVDIQWVIP